MQMTQETVSLAVTTGLELLGSNSDITIPAKHLDGVFLLKQLLGSIMKGEIGLAPTMGEDAPKTPSPKLQKAINEAVEPQITGETPAAES